MVKADYALAGTPDQVKKKLARIMEKSQAEYLIWLADQGVMSKEHMAAQPGAFRDQGDARV